ncbi:TPA: hypothetical protein ACUUCQ_005162 [Pseudomonas aeruginosa]
MSEVKRYDCTNGGFAFCQGCYQMKEDPLGDYVSSEDYDALVAKLAMAEDAAAKGYAARQQCGGMKMEMEMEMEMEIEELSAEIAALRARVVVPDSGSQRLLVSELVSLAAGLACRKPLSRLSELCEEQSRVTSARLRDHIDEAGDSLVYYAVDLRRIADELARINGKTVSEGLLRRISDLFPADMGDDGSGRAGWFPHVRETVAELRALLNQDKENGDHAA